MSVRRTRNDTDFWYCLLDPTVEYPVLDEDGDETGEVISCYEEAVEYYANVSPATGQAQLEQFGSLDEYDKVIFTADTGCPIDEHTVLFLDKEPEYRTVVVGHRTVIDPETERETQEDITVKLPVYDYIVRRVARSLNSVSIAVRKVAVT